MSSAGKQSLLSESTCRAVFRWARDGVVIPKFAELEIRAYARRVGAEDPLMELTPDEKHEREAVALLRRIALRVAEQTTDQLLKKKLRDWLKNDDALLRKEPDVPQRDEET